MLRLFISIVDNLWLTVSLRYDSFKNIVAKKIIAH